MSLVKRKYKKIPLSIEPPKPKRSTIFLVSSENFKNLDELIADARHTKLKKAAKRRRL